VYHTAKVAVEGHTDNTGNERSNQQLSMERAKSVVLFLAQQGIDQSRLSAMGYGSARPIAANDTEENRQKNRRVDLVVSDK
jgi:outer membrane protein OmpA-like peptidoglycan-associated protein